MMGLFSIKSIDVMLTVVGVGSDVGPEIMSFIPKNFMENWHELQIILRKLIPGSNKRQKS